MYSGRCLRYCRCISLAGFYQQEENKMDMDDWLKDKLDTKQKKIAAAVVVIMILAFAADLLFG